MRTIPIEVYDAFSDRVFGGNRASVVVEPEGLNEGEMRAIAAELAVPAACFVHRRGEAAFEARFFTPTQELVMCGHGIVAIFYSRLPGTVDRSLQLALLSRSICEPFPAQSRSRCRH